jgi:DNA-directed RNA polymerase subunit RPC12/RpoP
MRTADVDGKAIFLRLKRIQLALRILTAAIIVGLIILSLALREAFENPHPSFVYIILLFVVCSLVAVGAMLFLLRSRCPNCNAAFAWRWVRGDILKDDQAGRCTGCGIRINVPDL